MRPRIPAVAVAVALATAAPAVAAPTGVTVSQEGVAFRITWTADPAAPSGTSVAVSSSPDFPDTILDGRTCTGFLLGTDTTTLLRCPIAFTGTVHVRVAPVGAAAAVLHLPSAAFAFAPVPAPPQPAALVIANRRRVTCPASAGGWRTIDGDTRFAGRVLVGGTERVATDLPNPLTGETPSIFTPAALTYLPVNADVGLPLRCEITATNGAHSATWVAEGTVGHAAPAAMRPRRMLGELAYPPGYVIYDGVRARPLRRADLRAGAIAKAAVRASYGVTGDLDLTLTTYRRPGQADAAIGRRFCRDLRRSYARSSTPATPRRVITCGRTRLPGARVAFQGLILGSGIDDFGDPVAVAQAVVAGSAGNAAFVVSSTSGGSFTRRVRSARLAVRAANLMTPRIALAAARE
ncbi:MAG: hypothetical protein IT200_00855 [Thermoleophilia bacterium]|nr:hypothetical protein [Thermoleophilia bacterium]